MRDRNIVIAILVGAMFALTACGGMKSGKTENTTEAAAEAATEAAQTTQIPNPWKETENLEEAEKATGIDFEPPVDNTLPEGYKLVIYRYMDNLLEAVYEKEGGQIVIRVSKELSGTELSGDYNEYSKEWEENYKGLVVKCKGDGTLINCASADTDNMHFAVLINCGEEGRGLSADELRSLFMGMQAVPLEG